MNKFDNIIDRLEEKSVKYNKLETFFGKNDLLPMWVADMDFATGEFIQKHLIEKITNETLGYSYKGKEYYETIANWELLQHQNNIDTKTIIPSHGVVYSIAKAIDFFTDIGDEVIVQTPVYAPFFKKIKGLKRKVVFNSLIKDKGRYLMDFDSLKKSISEKTKMLILCNPHNPVGRVWSRSELETLSQICLEHNILVVSDEIHSDLCLFDNKFIPYNTISEETALNSITLKAASKTFNIAGLHHSYIIATNPNHRRYFELDRLKYTLEDNSLGSEALIAAYGRGQDWLEELKSYLEANVEYIMKFIDDNLPKIKIYKPEATYLIWLDFSHYNLNHNDLKRLLIDNAKVALSSGEDFGEGGSLHMRINLGTNRERVEECMKRIHSVFKDL